MTNQEIIRIYDYMITVYRNYKPQISREMDLIVWCNEFKDMNFEEVLSAFRTAMQESPVWAPNTQQIRDAWRIKREQARRRSPEQSFRDTHCGKNKEEWERLIVWEQSDERVKKFNEARERIKAICGG